MTTTLHIAHPTLKDPRTGDPLRAIGWTRRGPVWPVMGGAPDEPPADPKPEDPKPDADPKDDKGPKGGKDAVLADLATVRQANKDLKAKLDELAPLANLLPIAQLLTGKEKPEPDDLDTIKARLDQQDQKTNAANLRAVRAEVRAAAADFADLEDALLNAGDLAQYLREDGEVDTAAIATKLTAVLASKPHLKKADAVPARLGPRAPRPDPGQGASGNGDATSVQSGREAYKQRHQKKT
jgi:hypothetical protein